MTITFQPITIGIDGEQEANLVLAGPLLIAVLVRLSAQHEKPEIHGAWFVEIGFGKAEAANGLIFPDLEEAKPWFEGESVRDACYRRRESVLIAFPGGQRV